MLTIFDDLVNVWIPLQCGTMVTYKGDSYRAMFGHFDHELKQWNVNLRIERNENDERIWVKNTDIAPAFGYDWFEKCKFFDCAFNILAAIPQGDAGYDDDEEEHDLNRGDRLLTLVSHCETNSNQIETLVQETIDNGVDWDNVQIKSRFNSHGFAEQASCNSAM